jgi:hypothetical protein
VRSSFLITEPDLGHHSLVFVIHARRADLQDYRDMLIQVRQHVEDLIAAGKTMDEVVTAAPTKAFDAKWRSPRSARAMAP